MTAKQSTFYLTKRQLSEPYQALGNLGLLTMHHAMVGLVILLNDINKVYINILIILYPWYNIGLVNRTGLARWHPPRPGRTLRSPIPRHHKTKKSLHVYIAWQS